MRMTSAPTVNKGDRKQEEVFSPASHDLLSPLQKCRRNMDSKKRETNWEQRERFLLPLLGTEGKLQKKTHLTLSFHEHILDIPSRLESFPFVNF